MNVNIINPFLQGAQQTLSMVCGSTPSLGKLFVKHAPYICEAVSIQINFSGNLYGNVVYTMKPETACFIASKMMYGMPVSELDDMSKSALSELGNMISGNIATLLSGNGMSADITPPIFLMNARAEDFAFSVPNAAVVCIPLSLSDSFVFEVDVSVAERG